MIYDLLTESLHGLFVLLIKVLVTPQGHIKIEKCLKTFFKLRITMNVI